MSAAWAARSSLSALFSRDAGTTPSTSASSDDAAMVAVTVAPCHGPPLVRIPDPPPRAHVPAELPQATLDALPPHRRQSRCRQRKVGRARPRRPRRPPQAAHPPRPHRRVPALPKLNRRLRREPRLCFPNCPPHSLASTLDTGITPYPAPPFTSLKHPRRLLRQLCRRPPGVEQRC